MIRSFRSEWILLNRKKLWLTTRRDHRRVHRRRDALAISTARPCSSSPRRRAGPRGAGRRRRGDGGGDLLRRLRLILVLAAFASSTGNEFARGTLRSALTFQPQPVVVDGRQARRPSHRRGDPDGRAPWWSGRSPRRSSLRPRTSAPPVGSDVDALGEAAGGLRAAARVRRRVTPSSARPSPCSCARPPSPSASVCCGSVPIENVIGEGQAWAERWFPGMVLRSIVQPQAADSIATPTALATLGAYRRRLRRGDRRGDVEARRHRLGCAHAVRRGGRGPCLQDRARLLAVRFPRVGLRPGVRRRRGDQDHQQGARPGHQSDRHRRDLRVRPVGADRRAGDRRAPGGSVRGDQDLAADAGRPGRCRPGPAQRPPAEDRHHRPLPGAPGEPVRARWHDDGRDAPAAARRCDPPCRRQQLLPRSMEAG